MKQYNLLVTYVIYNSYQTYELDYQKVYQKRATIICSLISSARHKNSDYEWQTHPSRDCYFRVTNPSKKKKDSYESSRCAFIID